VNLATLERRLTTLAARLQSPAASLTAMEVARRAGIAPDPWQADVLTSNARQIVLLCSRQSGKSTTTAILATHQAVSVPDSLTLIFSPSLRQSNELYLKVRSTLAAVGGDAPEALEENATTLRLANGSRVISLPGSEKTTRGYSAPNLVIEDEAARVDDDLYQAIRPMLATSRGRHVMLSSPFGARGHFHEVWQRGGPAWLRVKVTAHDVPRIDPVWLAAERAAIGDWWFQQEYLCLFRDAIDSAFRGEDIDAMADTGIVPLFGRVA